MSKNTVNAYICGTPLQCSRPTHVIACAFKASDVLLVVCMQIQHGKVVSKKQ